MIVPDHMFGSQMVSTLVLLVISIFQKPTEMYCMSKYRIYKTITTKCLYLSYFCIRDKKCMASISKYLQDIHIFSGHYCISHTPKHG